MRFVCCRAWVPHLCPKHGHSRFRAHRAGSQFCVLGGNRRGADLGPVRVTWRHGELTSQLACPEQCMVLVPRHPFTEVCPV